MNEFKSVNTGRKTMITVSEPEQGVLFQRYTYTTTHDGTKTGRPWTKIKVKDYVGEGQYLIKVLMLRGLRLTMPYETIDSLGHILKR